MKPQYITVIRDLYSYGTGNININFFSDNSYAQAQIWSGIDPIVILDMKDKKTQAVYAACNKEQITLEVLNVGSFSDDELQNHDTNDTMDIVDYHSYTIEEEEFADYKPVITVLKKACPTLKLGRKLNQYDDYE